LPVIWDNARPVARRAPPFILSALINNTFSIAFRADFFSHPHAGKGSSWAEAASNQEGSTMSLSVKQIEAEWPKEEYDVMHGQWLVGRISHSPDSDWTWTLGGLAGGPDDLRRAGITATLPEAKAQMDDQWAKWLAYANLEPSEPSARPHRTRPDQQ
jgi:hypothetical protein